MASPTLVFMTPDNEEKIKAAMAPHVKEVMAIQEAAFKAREEKLKQVTEAIQRDAEAQAKREL